MKKILFFIALSCLTTKAQLTLDYCLERADANYPLLKKYGIIEQTMTVNLSDINRGWLPEIDFYAQGTGQNTVPKFPDALRGVLDQMGQNLKGLGKFQYKVGVDVSQKIWDGGYSRNQRDIARLQTELAGAEINVQLYAMHEKVISLFFGILLVEDQTQQTHNAVNLLDANRTKLRSMVKNGSAIQSDVDMVTAQILTLDQKITEAENAIKGYKEVLGIFIDENIQDKRLIRPEISEPINETSDRPELKLFEARQNLNNALYKNVEASLMPKVGFFAQAYYGYPGIDYFKAMMLRDPSFNILAGIKVSLNISPFYNKNNSRKKIELQSRDNEIDRSVFLFNNKLQSSSQNSEIEGLKAVAAKDSEIIDLRESIRKVAESQLDNGVIDMTGLLSKITDENQARLNASFHDIELLYARYKLKYILNR